MDFAYFEKNYRLIAADLCKQKNLGADLRAIQKIIFTSKIKVTTNNTSAIIYYILEQSKETMLEFATTEKTNNCCQKKKNATLRINLKMFDGNNLPHELLLITRKRQN